jgi:steroid 5-alpha reductase family enzyme
MSNTNISPKYKALLLCLFGYVLAFIVAFYSGYIFRGLHPIWIIAIADLIGTVIIFIFSMIFNNSSFYDPYWSVAPIPIAVFFMVYEMTPYEASLREIVVLMLVCIWGIRLTYNWASQWKGFTQEDWRYVDFRKKFPRLYWVISFLGIHLFPTIMVFLGSLSLYVSLSAETNAFGLLDILAIIITLGAIIIEATSDLQLRNFINRKDRKKEDIMSEGLWAYTRHPNYFGEVMFWFGLYIFALSANPSYWWVIIGPVSMTALFLFISIPMMEKHLIKKRPHYKVHQKKVSPFIPWFPDDTGIDDDDADEVLEN